MRTWIDTITCGNCDTEQSAEVREHAVNQWVCSWCGCLVIIQVGAKPALAGMEGVGFMILFPILLMIVAAVFFF